MAQQAPRAESQKVEEEPPYRHLATTQELLPTTPFAEQAALLNVAGLVRFRAKLPCNGDSPHDVSHESAETVI